MNMAKKRPNIVPIIEDARHPQKYRMLVPMVDVIFADVAQPDQVWHNRMSAASFWAAFMQLAAFKDRSPCNLAGTSCITCTCVPIGCRYLMLV